MIKLLPFLLILPIAPVQAIERGAFLSTLNRAGVSVVERRQCGRERNNVAVYFFKRNQICLSTRHTRTYSSLDRALTHEAVHAVQDCLAGQRNSQLQTLSATAGQSVAPFIRELEPFQLSFIQSQYPQSRWDIEIEAYALETRPAAVAELLSAVCP